ncbi:Mediates both low-affinity uptake and efflux of sugar across the membrane [Ancistrocladus abbreviatus]
MLGLYANDVLCRVVLGRDFSEGGEYDLHGFQSMLDEYQELLGGFSIGDFFPSKEFTQSPTPHPTSRFQRQNLISRSFPAAARPNGQQSSTAGPQQHRSGAASTFSAFIICKDAAGVAGNLFALGLFASPIPTFRRIIRNGSTEHFSGLPYIYALLNCLICTWYGMPFVSSGNLLVLTVNSVGAVFQLVYITLFIAHTDRMKKMKMLGLLVMVFCFYVVWIQGCQRISLLIYRNFGARLVGPTWCDGRLPCAFTPTIVPGHQGSSSASDVGNSYVHLYRLQRGLTNVVIQEISFSDDSHWIMISSSRGTNHLFAISPSGGPVNLQFADPSFKNSGLRDYSSPALQ